MIRQGIFLAVLLAVSPASAAPSLVGTFFGKGQPNDKESMYLDHFLANGEIHSQFRDCRNGKAYDSREDGNWSVAGDILTIKVTLHDGLPMPRTDVYKLNAVAARGFKETYLPLNFLFDEQRVADDFTMPDCQLTS